MKKVNASEKKSLKKKQRLLTSLFENDFRSIAELSKELTLSIPKVTAMLEELQKDRWVVESANFIPKNGRKPICFELPRKSKAIVIVDITINAVKLYLFDLGKEKLEEVVTNLSLSSPENFVKELNKEIKTLQTTSSTEIIAAGVSMPGITNSKTGLNLTYNFLNVKGNSLAKNISDSCGLYCISLNDSKATALGELAFGEAKNKEFALSVNADWGVGLGVISKGKVYQGASGFSGELGHIQIVDDGILCSCGKVGCLDTVTSATSLINQVKEGLANGRVSNLSKFTNNLEDINLEVIIEAAKNGDGFSIDILYNIGLELGKGLSIAVHLFNPEIIIINGILSTAYRFIINSLEHSINKYCLTEFKDSLEIKPSKLQNSARLLGTLTYTLENKIFKEFS